MFAPLTLKSRYSKLCTALIFPTLGHIMDSVGKDVKAVLHEAHCTMRTIKVKAMSKCSINLEHFFNLWELWKYASSS